MTQRDLAEASGLSLPQIGRYETGLSKPRMTAIVKLAKALNVPIEKLTESDSEPELEEITLAINDKPTQRVMPAHLFKWVSEQATEAGVDFELALNALLLLGARQSNGTLQPEDDIHSALEEVRNLTQKKPDDSTSS
jgi:transcriptional regulator with XRE-family HTH domain